MKLSKRMQAVAAMVSPGNVLADIGTDHGYVPIALVQEHVIPRAIAMDINEGPLERATAHIREYHLESLIETRRSNGVEMLREGEADSILIAGMGGELIIGILTAGETVCKKAKELILQPQSEIDEVRKYLRSNQYKIVDEDMVYEDGKYYPMMHVVPEEDAFWSNKDPHTIEVCEMYGPILLKNGNPVLRKFLVWQHKMLMQILAQLNEQVSSEKIERRIEEVKHQLWCNESAYSILGAIKDAGI